MHSAIYHGWLDHHRVVPRPHAFRQRLYMAYLDLAELDRVFRGRWLWSTRRAAVSRFDRRDHFGDHGVALDEAVRALVEARTGNRPTGPVRVLTQLRTFGYVFNPVCFHYCFDADDRHVEAVVAEVTNTPWGERHCYVLAQQRPGETWLRARSAKRMHVSPFHPMALEYRWMLREPAEDLLVHMALGAPSAAGGSSSPIFGATLALRRKPVTAASLAWALARFPFITGQVIAGIHWQALRLWCKGVPVHDHPGNGCPLGGKETSS